MQPRTFRAGQLAKADYLSLTTFLKYGEIDAIDPYVLFFRAHELRRRAFARPDQKKAKELSPTA